MAAAFFAEAERSAFGRLAAALPPILPPFLAEALELPANHLGVYVATVIPDGPSDKAGIQGGTETVTDENGFEYERGGDIITAVDGIPVMRFEDLVSFLVVKASPGQVITLTVLRGEETLEIPVTLGERPATAATARTVPPASTDRRTSRSPRSCSSN